MVNMRPNTNGDRTEGLDGDRGEPSVLTSQKKGELQREFLGRNLESIIAKVAVERKRAGKALRSLTGKLIQAQEEERRRLARELHDGLNQELAILTMELGMVAKQVPETEPAIREQLYKLRDRTEGLASDLHRMTHELHPAALELLGLVPALRSHCAEFSANAGIRVWFRVVSELGRVHPETAVCLYRIAQEALRNVAKHSRAEEAWVEIEQGNGEIRLSIVDKGVGFKNEAPDAGTCLGLISMRERVRLLSGMIKIKSAPGEGTCVEVRVPAGLSQEIKLVRRNHAKAKTLAG
jgi:signal transduction histidine kinase